MRFLNCVEDLHPIHFSETKLRTSLDGLYQMAYNIDPVKLLVDNGIAFKNHAEFMEVRGIRIDKDHYTDGLRLYGMVKQLLEDRYHSALMVPFNPRKLNELSHDQQWDLREYMDTQPASPSTNPQVYRQFQVPVDDYMIEDEKDQESEELLFKEIVVNGVYEYHNIVGVRNLVRRFFRMQRAPGWVCMDCELTCVPKKHAHAIYAKYPDAFTFVPNGAQQRETISLAPPFLCNQMLTVPKLFPKQNAQYVQANRLVDQIRDEAVRRPAIPVVEKVVVVQSATESVSIPEDDNATANSVEPSSDDLIFPTSIAAYDYLVKQNDLNILKQVVRLSQNLRWVVIKNNASSGNNFRNKKAALSQIYNKQVIEQLSKQPDPAKLTLCAVLMACREAIWKIPEGENARQSYLGWMINRIGAGDTGLQQDERTRYLML